MAFNSILGVAAESVTAAAEVMLLPSLILAFFVAELTPSYATIGLVPAAPAKSPHVCPGPQISSPSTMSR